MTTLQVSGLTTTPQYDIEVNETDGMIRVVSPITLRNVVGVSSGSGSGVTTFAQLTDTDVATRMDNQIPVYDEDSGKWTNRSIIGGDNIDVVFDGNTVTFSANTTFNDLVVTGNLNAYSMTLEIPLSVSSGGTGLSNVSVNAILFGQGDSSMAEVTGSGYDILQLDANGIPTFGSIDGGTF